MLRQGLGVTWMFAAVGACGRVVVPILLQQAIDKGIVRDGGVRVGFVGVLALIAAGALIISGIAQRQAIVRLGTRSEQALFHLRTRLIGHIHRLSLADHNEERRGALVARVTSDIETLAQFFSWGGLAWLLNGPLMLLVAGVMLAYDWVLAIVAFAIAAPLAFVLRIVQRHLVHAYEKARERNGEMMSADHRGRRRVGDDPGLRGRRHLRHPCRRGDRRPGQGPGARPASSARCCSRRASCSPCSRCQASSSSASRAGRPAG